MHVGRSDSEVLIHAFVSVCLDEFSLVIEARFYYC